MTRAPLLLAAVLLAGCSSSATLAPPAGGSETISKATFKGTWPFSVSSGILGCTSPNVVTFNTGGTTYFVNDAAQNTQGLPEVTAIWRKNPAIPGARIYIGDIIDAGLALCKG